MNPEHLMPGVKVSLAGMVTYAVFDSTGKILNAGKCHHEAVPLCAAGFKDAHWHMYDAHIEAPRILYDMIDTETGEILRDVTHPREMSKDS